VGPRIILAGGGTLPDTIWKRFVQMSGGENARILVIPTARQSDSGYKAIYNNEFKTLKKLGVRSVEMLHAPNRSMANTDSFFQKLENCDGVWIAGGYPCLLTESYTNTSFNDALKKWVSKGGVLGGTSAGASVIGEIIPRTIGCREKMSQNSYTGFKIIPKTIIDQHFITRGREYTLIEIQKKLSDHLGIGIDEGTALVINDNLCEVIGISKVILFWPKTIDKGDLTKKMDTTHFVNGSSFILDLPN
ncbi:MAG TPA: cyanophycinase, partial [Phnomibacter sp.]|nr:cyanophycinase [Phnomibacter sp.]